MVLSKEDFIDLYAQKLRNEEASIFIGAGISMQLGLPSWKKLLTPCAKKLHLDIEDINDYYLLSQYYSNSFGISELKRFISPELYSECSENKALEQVTQMNYKTIWTTNFDSVIENALKSHHIRHVTINNDYDLANISHYDVPIIYKLNGDIHDLEHIILTHEDWENYRYTHPTMLTFLKKELVSNTFLFLGYSFEDGLIKSMLSDIKRFVGDSCAYHYTIMKNERSSHFSYFIQDLEKRYHVKTILIENYDEIAEILAGILYKMNERNIFISGRLDDVEPEVENYACQLGKLLSTCLLKNNYNIYTGMGRKIGYFIAGPALQYLLTHRIRHLERRICIRPFDDTDTPENKFNYRRYLLQQNNVVIFMFGQHFENGNSCGSPGMYEEFTIAKQLHMKIIPIGSTGYESARIWREIKENIINYPYLELYVDTLMNEKSPSKICQIVEQILEDIIE